MKKITFLRLINVKRDSETTFTSSFPQTEFIKIDKEIIPKYKDLHTDAEAAIYD
jgi:hypothetical protein